MNFEQIQSALYSFVGDLMMQNTVQQVAEMYEIQEYADFAEVMDQAVSVEMRNFFA